jgi:large subunit ribosomal protein L22
MEVKAVQKFVRMSPRKLRPVADVARGLKPTEAIEVLPHLGKRAANPLNKVIKTALANAKQKGVSQDDLDFKEIQINEGPRLKRGRPVSRGRWHPFQKRMSHIRVVLMVADSKGAKPKTKKSGRRVGKKVTDKISQSVKKATSKKKTKNTKEKRKTNTRRTKKSKAAK